MIIEVENYMAQSREILLLDLHFKKIRINPNLGRL